jgi:hypothetical protein
MTAPRGDELFDRGRELEEIDACIRRAAAGQGGLVVVCGSMFLVGQLRAHVLGERVDPLPTSDPISRP